MKITRNADGSYSAQGRYKGRPLIAEGSSRQDVIQSYIYLIEDINNASC